MLLGSHPFQCRILCIHNRCGDSFVDLNSDGLANLDLNEFESEAESVLVWVTAQPRRK